MQCSELVDAHSLEFTAYIRAGLQAANRRFIIACCLYAVISTKLATSTTIIYPQLAACPLLQVVDAEFFARAIGTRAANIVWYFGKIKIRGEHRSYH